MKKDWTYKLRQKLEGHQSSPPPGLWESISEQMGMAPEPVRKPILIRRWRWAAAAAILALVGFFVLYETSPSSSPTAPSSSPIKGRAVAEVNDDEIEKNESVIPVITEEKTRQALIAKAEPVRLTKTEKEEPAPVVTEESRAETSADVASIASDTVTVLATKTEKPSRPVRDSERLIATTAPSHRGSRERRFSIGLEGSGNLLSAQTIHREDRIYTNVYGYRSVPSSEMAYGSSPLYTQTVYSLTDYATKHYLPLRFGLSMHWHFARRLDLITGLHYTYMHSELSIPLYDKTLRDQRLHYLGLPLGLSCQVWGNTHFQVYASATGMVEKCLNERPWQWSVDASAGAEYTFARQWGIYVEPSVGYFFKDRTSLQHYYKEHPVTPSIEIGLRVHLNK